MTLAVAGSLAISGASGAYASACCNGEGRTATPSGNGQGTPTANGNALVHAGTTLSLTAGSLSVNGGKAADASACCNGSVGGKGTGTTTVNANAELSAGQSMTISVSGPMIVTGGSNQVYGSACCNGEGGTGVPRGNGQGIPTTSANALVHAGSSLTLSAGSLTVAGGGPGTRTHGVDASACCNGSAGGSGIGITTVRANGEISSGQDMRITITGPLTVAGGNKAFASACCNGESNIGRGLPPGNGTGNATANANGYIKAATTLNISAASITVQGGSNATAKASNNMGPGAGIATANANALIASGGDMSIAVTAGDLTVAGGSTVASTKGTGNNTAIANANAGIFALGVKTINVNGNVSLTGGTTNATGAGAAPSAFAMLDPGSLDLTASTLTLTPNSGGVVLSALGPINLMIGGVATPLSTYAGIPGVIVGQGTLTSSETSTSFNITNRFGLPPGFLPGTGDTIIVDIAAVAAPAGIFWDGGAETFSWLDALNWSTDHLPSATQDVTIHSLASPVTLTGLATIRSLFSSAGITLSGEGASLTMANASTINNTLMINAGGTVNANGGLTVKALNLSDGALNGLGNLIVSNSFSHTGGTIGTGFGLIDITQTTGNLTIANSLSTGAIRLQTNDGQITQTGGGLSANSLAVRSGGNVALNGPNMINTLAADLTGGSGNFEFVNNQALTVGSAGGINGVSTNSGNINLTTTSGALSVTGGVTSAGGSVTLTSADTLFGSGIINGSTINLSSVNGMSVLVGSSGPGLRATNSGTGNLVLTITAPTFTVDGGEGGGATFSNNVEGSGGYVITAQNNMVLRGGTANDRQAFFGAGNLLTVDGYSNPTGLGVVMAGNNVTFSGAMTDVSGALGVLAGSVNVNTTVQGGSVSVAASNLNVNGGDFRSIAGTFSGFISGDINVSNGGRIYGTPDVDLTVGGAIVIDGPNSKIEATSPTSFHHLTFPLRSEGGFVVNGVPGQVFDPDPVTGPTGFFADGAPAVLGRNLLVDYGVAGLPPNVISAINSTIAAVNTSTNSNTTTNETGSQDNKGKGKDADKGKDTNEKSQGNSNNLKLQCN